MIDPKIKAQLKIDPELVDVLADAEEERGRFDAMRETARAAARRYELGARWARWTNKALAAEYMRRAERAYRRGRSFMRARKCAEETKS